MPLRRSWFPSALNIPDMTSIPTEVLVKRRAELLAQVDDLNVRINEVEHWIALAGEAPETGYRALIGTPPETIPVTEFVRVVKARNPRKINKK